MSVGRTRVGLRKPRDRARVVTSRRRRLALASLLALTSVVVGLPAAAANDVLDPPYPGIILNAGPFPPNCSVSATFPCSHEQTARFTVTGTTFTDTSVIVDLNVVMLPFTFVAGGVTYDSYDSVRFVWDESRQWTSADGGQNTMILPELLGDTVIGVSPTQRVQKDCNPGACRIEFVRRPWMVDGLEFWMPLPFIPRKATTPLVTSGNRDENTMIVLTAPNPNPNLPPSAAFDAQAHTPRSLRWDFDASASAAFGGATIDDYAWDFGDHETAHGPSAVTDHKYAGPGPYHVTLTVRDSRGDTDVASRDIEVSDPGLVVNSVADIPNGAQSGSQCDTGNTVGGEPECTLRAAIEAANTANKSQSITFAIGVAGTPQITLASELPILTAPVAIDGTTQDGNWVELFAPNNTMRGLFLQGVGASVTGFVFRGFDVAVLANGEGVQVLNNRFGTNPAGTAVTVPPKTAVLTGGAAGTGIVIADNVMAVTDFGIQAIEQGTGSVTGNRIGVNADGSAALGPEPAVGVLLRDVGAWTVSGNVIRHGVFGVKLGGASTGGTLISANKIGVNASATARIASTGLGIAIDGVPDATVSDNDVSMTSVGFGANPSIDIVVTGVEQCETTGDGSCAFHPPGNEVTGTVTGGNVTVTQNRVGAIGGSTIGVGGTGVAVYAQAPGVTVSANHSAGHRDYEILVAGATDTLVAGNNVGTNAAGTVALGGAIGVNVAGAQRTRVEGNLVSGIQGIGVLVTNYLAADAGTVMQSKDTLVENNRVGTNLSGTAAIPNSVGVSVEQASETTAVADSLISGNTGNGVQVTASATGTIVIRNRIGTTVGGNGAIPNQSGIVVSGAAADTGIIENLVGGNTGAGIALSTSDHTLVSANRVGVAGSGAPIPNAVGITVDGAATIGRNIVWSNTGNGIDVAAGSQAWLNNNSTYANGGKGIAASAPAPAPPKLDVVRVNFAGGETRTWFVVGQASTTDKVELFVNPDCSDPNEGRDLVPVAHVLGVGTNSVLLADGALPAAGGYTATVTHFTGAKSSTGAAIALTSEYSNCAAPATYPDTSGTGIPDLVQLTLLGDPGEPRTVVFPGDGGSAISLLAFAGRLANVRPVTAPTGADGVQFPAGLFSFEITGLEPGASVDVDAFTGKPASAYWRNGPTFPGGAPHWYEWSYNPITNLGAKPLTPDANGQASSWRLSFTDGKVGDDDFAANGTVVDPGGPGNGTLTADPPQPEVAPGQGLAFTGSRSTPELALIAFVLIGVGLVLRRIAARRRRSFRPRVARDPSTDKDLVARSSAR